MWKQTGNIDKIAKATIFINKHITQFRIILELNSLIMNMISNKTQSIKLRSRFGSWEFNLVKGNMNEVNIFLY